VRGRSVAYQLDIRPHEKKWPCLLCEACCPIECLHKEPHLIMWHTSNEEVGSVCIGQRRYMGGKQQQLRDSV